MIIKYKYINSVIRWVIIVVGLGYLFYEVFQVTPKIEDVKISNLWCLILAVMLFLINYSIEAKKWKLIADRYEQRSFLFSLQVVFSSIALGVLTPNRLGEVPGKALFYRSNKVELSSGAIFLSWTQFLSTVIFGLWGVSYFKLQGLFSKQILLLIVFVLLVGLLLLIFFPGNLLINKLKTRYKSLFNWNYFPLKFKSKTASILFSLLRYLIFSIQYILLFKSFDVNYSIELIQAITVYLLLITIIPSFVWIEIGVRTSLSIFVFKNLDIPFSILIIVPILMWLINVVIPAFVGFVLMNKLQLFNK